ncbi:4-phosphoerythronate dehydrogenase [Aliiglaciecola lipolytica]|uniref:Erythronate-4-phosphate dehydrogenase n=1 Tax=Aliiglaciecola lipolytica E3 TaxID=1127673 RepID=K6YQ62_9ALTE|nr:4-phosphoerythronate dehydrogenase [Aliiglaciecola lipolytica]GAC13470.1 erythronate-4-phosphate dehydrogenase [Aliiglaciecola lipolytica E3]
MKILYEDSMPYAEHFFSKVGECQAYSSQTLTPEALQDVDVLLVRSTTKVTEKLLSKAHKLKYVATATAGSDHLDKPMLARKSIPWGSAAGCNAIAVAEYVLSCLMTEYASDLPSLLTKTVGIVGAGHVGSQLDKRLKLLGINTKLCDPPLHASGDHREFVSIDEICECDIISLHVPFVATGEYSTKHMFDSKRLTQLKESQLLINACRGEVIDNQAAKTLFESGKAMRLNMDVWENEPTIDFELVPHCRIGTAHIAGHSLEGKARGTYFLYQQLCERFQLPQKLSFESCLPNADVIEMSQLEGKSEIEQVSAAILATYNVMDDSQGFKKQVKSAADFVYSRKHYAIRREFASVTLKTGNFPVSEALYGLGFNTIHK